MFREPGFGDDVGASHAYLLYVLCYTARLAVLLERFRLMRHEYAGPPLHMTVVQMLASDLFDCLLRLD